GLHVRHKWIIATVVGRGQDDFLNRFSPAQAMQKQLDHRCACHQSHGLSGQTHRAHARLHDCNDLHAAPQREGSIRSTSSHAKSAGGTGTSSEIRNKCWTCGNESTPVTTRSISWHAQAWASAASDGDTSRSLHPACQLSSNPVQGAHHAGRSSLLRSSRPWRNTDLAWTRTPCVTSRASQPEATRRRSSTLNGACT